MSEPVLLRARVSLWMYGCAITATLLGLLFVYWAASEINRPSQSRITLFAVGMGIVSVGLIGWRQCRRSGLEIWRDRIRVTFNGKTEEMALADCTWAYAAGLTLVIESKDGRKVTAPMIFRHGRKIPPLLLALKAEATAPRAG